MRKKLNNKGFTIVEVLIVLAIAGAILAAVLIAVPALQRSGRNATAKTAAQQLVAGVQEYASANGGTYPTGMTGLAGSAKWTALGVAGSQAVTTTVSATIKPSWHATGAATAPTPGTVVAYASDSCNATNSGASAGTGIAIIYPIENGGTTVMGCIQA
jgi:prepilin-type N-terminal cleavage/methylation domain-containing protein